jgi:hypothetical protein
MLLTTTTIPFKIYPAPNHAEENVTTLNRENPRLRRGQRFKSLRGKVNPRRGIEPTRKKGLCNMREVEKTEFEIGRK